MKFIYLLALLFSSAVFGSDFMQRYIDETTLIEEQRLASTQKETTAIIAERKNLEKELKKLKSSERELLTKQKKLQKEKTKLGKELGQTKKDLSALWTSYEKQLSLLKALWLNSEIGFFYPEIKEDIRQLDKMTISSAAVRELTRISKRSLELSKLTARKSIDFFGPDDLKMKADAWHIGLMSFFNEDFYLHMNKELASLGVWPSLSSKDDWEQMNVSSKTKTLGFDISSGSLFKYLKNYPSLYDQWIYGGIVLKIISLLFLLSLALIGLKFSYIKKFRKSIMTYADFHKALEALGEANMDTIESTSSFDTFMNKVDCDLHRNLSLIKVFASICPLLGLLGTITGMIETFQGLSMASDQSSTIMASGISKALITTVGGLVAAIPLLIMHNIVFQYATASVQKAEDTFNLKK